MERRTHSERRAPCGRTEGRRDGWTQGWCPWAWPGPALQHPMPPGTLLLQDGSGSRGTCLRRGCCGRSGAEPAEFSPKHATKDPVTNPLGQQHPRLGAWAAGTCTQPPSSPAAASGSPGLGQALTLPRCRGPGEPGWSRESSSNSGNPDGRKARRSSAKFTWS